MKNDCISWKGNAKHNHAPSINTPMLAEMQKKVNYHISLVGI